MFQDCTVSSFSPRVKYLYPKEMAMFNPLITTQNQGSHRHSAIWFFGAINFNNRMIHFVLHIAQS